MLRHRAQTADQVPSPPTRRPESETMQQSGRLTGRPTSWHGECDPFSRLLGSQHHQITRGLLAWNTRLLPMAAFTPEFPWLGKNCGTEARGDAHVRAALCFHPLQSFGLLSRCWYLIKRPGREISRTCADHRTPSPLWNHGVEFESEAKNPICACFANYTDVLATFCSCLQEQSPGSQRGTSQHRSRHL